MTKPKHAQIEELIRKIILPFYHVMRGMPLPVGERRWENDAEHSWSVAFLACALAPQLDPTLDVGKIAQYAIAHDLVEVYATDTSTFDDAEKIATKSEREDNALRQIANETVHFPWIVDTIHEYEQRGTKEARFVYAVDKYIATTYDYIDEGKLFRERKITLDDYNHSLTDHRTKAQSHSEIGKYYDEVRALLNSHPEFFHVTLEE